MHLLGFRDMGHVAIRVSCRSRKYKTKQNKTRVLGCPYLVWFGLVNRHLRPHSGPVLSVVTRSSSGLSLLVAPPARPNRIRGLIFPSVWAGTTAGARPTIGLESAVCPFWVTPLGPRPHGPSDIAPGRRPSPGQAKVTGTPASPSESRAMGSRSLTMPQRRSPKALLW